MLLFVLSALLAVAPVAADRELALTSNQPVIAVGAAARALDAFDDDDQPRAHDGFLRTLINQARHPLVRDFARRRRARTSNNIDEITADLDAMGMPRAVRCVGPFSNTGGVGFATTTTADDVGATIKGAVTGLDHQVRWTQVPRDLRGAFEVDDRFVARREVRARCVVVVDVGIAITAAVRVGASAAVVVRHGDGPTAREVLKLDEDHPLGFDQGAGLVALPRGKSLLVVEVGVLARGASLELRVTNTDGTPLRGLNFSAAVADIAAAATVNTRAPTTTTLASLTVGDAALAGDRALVRGALSMWSTNNAYDFRGKPTRFERALNAADTLAVDDAERVRLLVTRAEYVRERDPSQALAALSRATALRPDDVDVLVGMARLREQQGDDPGASALWTRIVKAAPRRTSLVVERLTFERRRGVLGVIVDDDILKRARTSHHEGLVTLAADVLEERGDIIGALHLLETIGEQNSSGFVGRFVQMSEARLARDPNARAALLDALRMRLRFSPSSHHLARSLVTHLLDAGDDKAAAAVVDDQLRLFPERPEPLQLAAMVALLADDVELATTRLTTALSLTPDDGELQRSLRALKRREKTGADDLATRLLPAFSDDVVVAARATPPTEAQNIGAYIHHKIIGTHFFENGQLQRVEDVVVVVLDAKKAASLRTFDYGYSGGREQLEVLAAERISSAGRREGAERVVDRGQDGKENGAYSDARSKTVVFSTLEDGDVLHVRVRKEATGLQNLFGDFFGDVEVLQSRLPLRHFRMTIEAPTSRPLYVGGRGAPAPVVRDGDNVRVWDLAVDNVAALQGEQGMPPWLEVADYVSVSTYGSWGGLGQWYEALVADQLRLDDDLRQVAATLKAAASDKADLVRRVYEHVVTSTRYVGIELGIHGWKPYPVSEVYRRRFGDCKDKASLLVALLREVGVDAHLVLVRTIQLGHTGESPPSMWSFNHAIAWVKDLDLFLDGTAERSGWRELPTMDQGALALIVDGANSRLVTMPVQSADQNANTSDYVLQIQTDGALVANGEEHFRGANNSKERQRLDDVANRRLILERELSQSIPGVQVKSIDVGDLSLATEEIRYGFSAVLPRRAVVEADGSLIMPVSLYPHDVAGNYAEQSTRRFELFIDHPWRTRNVMRYVVPAGMVVVDLPEGGEVSGKHLHFKQIITPTADGFIVDEDTAIVSRRIPVEDYGAFRDQAVAADRLMKRKLRLVRSATTKATR